MKTRENYLLTADRNFEACHNVDSVVIRNRLKTATVHEMTSIRLKLESKIQH